MTSLALACRLGAVTAPRSIPRRVRAILNKYGATMLLPGVAEPILGPELVSSIVAPTTYPQSIVVSGLSFSFTDNLAVQYRAALNIGVLTAGRKYYVSVESSNFASVVTFLRNDINGGGATVSNSAVGAKYFEFTPVSNGSHSILFAQSSGSFSGTVTVREILGYNHTRYSYQAGNYRESTGQTLAAADQQVGLAVDAARVPGPELAVTAAIGVGGGFVNNGDGSYTKPVGVEGSLAINGNSVPSGNYVRFRFEVVSLTGHITPYVGGEMQSAITSVGPKEINAKSGASIITEASIYCSAANSVTVRAISVRELPGIHASQATSGFQPVLRNTAGIQSWQFDGVDDRLSLSAVPFQMADDHFVVAAFSPTKNNATYFVPSRKASGNVRFASVSMNAAGVIYSEWYDGTQYIAHTAPATLGSDYVVSSIKQGSVVKSRVNAAQIGNSIAFTTAVQGTEGFIGNGPYGYFEGKGAAVIFGNGAITDSELLTLEKFAAKLQGRSL